MNETTALSRRDWLRSGGALVVSFAMGASFQPALAQNPQPPGPGRGGLPAPPADLDNFLAVHTDGTVTPSSPAT
jgi:hypothetical protein